MKKYQKLYETIKSRIESGHYARGERIPSVREQSRLSGYSVNTVLRSYEFLIDEGYVRATERGGFYIRSDIHELTDMGLGKPLPLPQQFVSEAEQTGQRLEILFSRLLSVDSGFATAAPGDDLLPTEALQQIAARLNRSWINYGAIEGERSFRQRIAMAGRDVSGGISQEDIIVTNGATEGMSLVLSSLLSRGDTVAVESPTYHNFLRQLSSAGLRILEIPVGPNGMDLDILESEFKKRKIAMVLVQPNVQNPTGISMNSEAKLRLVELSRRHGVIVLQDDVFGDLYFDAFRPPNLSSLSDYPEIITLSSFSKSIAPGLRIGWIESPKYKDLLQDAKLRTSMESSLMAQNILKSYIGTKAHRIHLKSIRVKLENRLGRYLNRLSDLLPEGCYVRRPSGGCLLWIRLPSDIDGTELFKRSARKGLVAAPGALFSSGNNFNNFIRLNAGFPLNSQREDALSILGECINR